MFHASWWSSGSHNSNCDHVIARMIMIMPFDANLRTGRCRLSTLLRASVQPHNLFCKKEWERVCSGLRLAQIFGRVLKQKSAGKALKADHYSCCERPAVCTTTPRAISWDKGPWGGRNSSCWDQQISPTTLTSDLHKWKAGVEVSHQNKTWFHMVSQCTLTVSPLVVLSKPAYCFCFGTCIKRVPIFLQGASSGCLTHSKIACGQCSAAGVLSKHGNFLVGRFETKRANCPSILLVPLLRSALELSLEMCRLFSAPQIPHGGTSDPKTSGKSAVGTSQGL